MSFILDALKRSEREREETARPNDASPAGDKRPGRGRLWIWIAGAVLSLNALGVAAFFMLPSGGQPKVEIALSPAGTEGGAPAPATGKSTGTELEWALLTARSPGPPGVTPGAPPSPPVLMKDPETAPPPEPVQAAALSEPAQAAALPEPAQPAPSPEPLRISRI